MKFISIDNEIEDQLVHEAWKIVSDSLKTTICIRFHPKPVAAAAIYAAATSLKIDLSEVVGKPGNDPIELELFPDAPATVVKQIIECLKHE